MKKDLVIPESVLQQHLAILGKTGAGKSSVLRYLAEHLLARDKRVCIVDPKGDHWGLKSNAAGTGPGFPVIAFGDFKNADATDVPINQHSGKHVAELVASGNRPCIIGFRGWMTAHMVQFWIDFAAGIFNANHGELYLLGDEFHNFAPKGKIMDPQAGKCLHWSNRLLSEGRGLGIVCLIASQRPQKVHNDTLTSCETLVAMRVIHSADRSAVQEWIEGCGDKEQGKLVLNSLAGMERGEAYVWSPEAGFGPARVKFPLFQTFDSFAPPQLQKKHNAAGWSTVNLDEVKERLAKVIEEHQANDPQQLKRRIHELETQINQSPKAEPLPAERVEVSVLSTADREVLDKLVSIDFQGLQQTLSEAERVQQILRRHLQGSPPPVENFAGTLPAAGRTDTRVRSSTPVQKRAAAQALSSDSSELDQTKQNILDTVAMLEVRGIPANRESVARWLDIHPNGGRYGSNLAALRAGNYLEGFQLTATGRAAAAALPTGFEYAKLPLDGSQREILDTLHAGGTFTRDTLAAALGIHPNGGRYGSNLARLRTMGLIPERGEIYLCDSATR